MKTLEIKDKLMGGTWSMRCYVDQPLYKQGGEDFISQIMAQAFAEVRRIEDLLTDFHDSPFNQINQMAGLAPVEVPQEIIDLIQLSLHYSRETEGAFDISYASVGHLWRKARETGKLPTEAQISQAQTLVDYRQIQIDPHMRTVFLPHREMRIGLGGIGKGYAVDRAFEFLRQQGLVNFYVNGQGDMRVHATDHAPRPWRIGVRNPLSSDPTFHMGIVQLRNGAVATSGDYHKYIQSGVVKYHHVIDPQTGRPTQGVIGSTVVAATAMEADVLATSLMVMNLEKGSNFLNRRRQVGFLVTHQGSVHLSSMALQEMKKYADLITPPNPQKGPKQQIIRQFFNNRPFHGPSGPSPQSPSPGPGSLS